MNEDPLPQLHDVLLRRELTPAEERAVATWLARRPEAAAEWNETVRLARAIRGLPQAPVPSNFTARVLDEVRRDLARTERDRNPNPRRRVGPAWFSLRRWIPAATAVTVAMVAGWEWHQRNRLTEFTRDVAPLRVIAAVPQEVLQDFEAIQRFGQSSPSVDFELLAALE